MRTIRGRLAVWYAVALGATMFVFALAIYLVQRTENFAELDERARLESELIARILSAGSREQRSLVVTDATGRAELAPAIASLLEVIPDYVIVVGRQEEALFLSADARALPYGAL